ncbi:MAG: tRNA 2-thiocytidine(32) synthetase TtcA [Polyangiaceae bacterium]|nr:tRNA 2-thiocytidine(32) synthetase TtcA [Polyangiaceae bacterium]
MIPARKLEERLLGRVARASAEHALLEPGDRVAVAVSGGKDSLVLLHLLRRLRERLPFPISLVAVHVDQGHPGFPSEQLPAYFRAEGVEHEIVREDTYSIVTEKLPPGSTYCSLCSRLRRGILYNLAVRLGATKLALGHHRDDVIETLLLNLFYAGQLKAMPARLRSDDGRNVVIRPLVYCDEASIAELAAALELPIVPCNLCGSQEQLQRKRMKALLRELTAENSNVPGNVFAALANVRPSHLYDRALRELVAPEPAAEAAAPRRLGPRRRLPLVDPG